MSQRGNFPHPNPYSGGVPGWGESPMNQRGPHPGGQPGFWGQRGPSSHNRSFEHRGPPGHSPSPRGHFSPRYSSSPFMQQTPHQQHHMNRNAGGNGSPRFHQFGGQRSGGGQFTSPQHRHSSPGQGNHSRNTGNSSDISAYYCHSMVEDPWKGLIATPTTTGTTT